MIPTPLKFTIAGIVLLAIGFAIEYFRSPEEVFKHYRRIREGEDNWNWSELPTGLGVVCLVIAVLIAWGIVN